MKSHMSKSTLLVVLLCSVLIMSLSMIGCKGDTGSAGANGANGTNGANGSNGTNGTNGTSAAVATSYTTTITSVVWSSGSGSAKATINFKVQDNNGNAIPGITDADVQSSTKLAHLLFNVAKLLPGVPTQNGASTTPNTWRNITSENLISRLNDLGNGVYTYVTGTIPTSGAATTSAYFDSTQYTRVVLRVAPNNSASRSPVVWEWSMGHLAALGAGEDAKFDTANTSTVSQDVVPTSSCLKCHDVFGSEDLNPLAFHAGEGRVEMYACVVCHYETRGAQDVTATVSGTTYTFPFGEAQIGNFVHKIHTAQDVSGTGDPTNGENFSGVTYPQDIRACTTCHSGGADSDNWMNKPSAKACLSCHNPGNPEFSTMTPLTDPGTTHTGGQIGPIGSGAAADDTLCNSCHTPTIIARDHRGVIATTNNSVVSAGVATFVYEISSAVVGTANTASNASNPVTVTFRVKMNGNPVTFNAYSSSTNTTTLINNFSGSPSFIVTYATPQDGIASPSDWNSGHTAVTILNLWDGSKGSLSAPDSNGYYTAVLSGGTTTNVALNVPTSASMVTVFLKDSFTQLNLGYPYGLVVPGVPAIATASGYTPRRTIFSESKCNACHDRLGSGPVDLTFNPAVNPYGSQFSAPGFHSGSYSIAMCGACHTPNQSSNGWSASFRVWVHGIHSASKRAQPFVWHAVSATDTYADVEYPGVLSDCEQCHLPGTYDFSASAYTANNGSLVNNMLNVLVARGTYTTTGTGYRNSPYVTADGATAYGSTNYGVAFAATTGNVTITPADGGTLVSSPITATCSACHDSTSAIAHMRSNGGLFYATRTTANANPNSEGCLVCHGPGRISAIADVHKK